MSRQFGLWPSDFGFTHAMNPTARLASSDEVLPLRVRYREEMNCQIVHDSIHRREGWTKIYLLELAGQPVGFGDVAIAGPWNGKPTLLCFHVLPGHRTRVFALFEALVHASGACFIEAQTNCGLAGILAQTYGRGLTTEKIVFRDGQTTALTGNGALLRQSTLDEEIRANIERQQGGGEWLLELNGERVASGGILFHYNRPYGDIYMDVPEAHRRRGFGSYLVQELKRRCYELGAVPAARCGPDNIASRQTLLKAGFVPCGEILVGPISAPRQPH